MADNSLIIKIDGDESGYKKSLKNVEKQAEKSADNVNDVVEKSNDTIQKEINETEKKIEESAQKAIKETKSAADEAKKAAAEVAKKNQKAMDDSASVVGGLNLAAKAAVMAIGTAGAAVVGMGMKYNAEMEQYKAGFDYLAWKCRTSRTDIGRTKGFCRQNTV